MSKMNRIANSSNSFQGKTKKVLCVCSAGLLRSPTAAVVLSQEPFNYNTRAAGITEEYALIPVDDVLIKWADEIMVMEQWMAETILAKYGVSATVLDIDDRYAYRDPKLVELIKKNYREYLNGL